MMEYNKFKEELVAEVSLENSKVEVFVAIKNNIELEGLRCWREESNVTPIIYIQHLYEQYESGMELEEIIEKVLGILATSEVPNIDVNSLLQAENQIFQIGNKEAKHFFQIGRAS